VPDHAAMVPTSLRQLDSSVHMCAGKHQAPRSTMGRVSYRATRVIGFSRRVRVFAYTVHSQA
jgi:hypothetical protein